MNARPSIERIPAPDLTSFEQEYLLKQTPVILTDLFREQPISTLSEPEAVRAALGSIELSEAYVLPRLGAALQLGQVSTLSQPLSLGEYLIWAQANVTERKICKTQYTQQTLPTPLQGLFKLPEYCTIGTGIDDTAYVLFVGNAGSVAHLHFDGDYRHVLLYQFFGTKRVILIPPNEAKKLHPLGTFSAWFLENMTEADQQALVQFTHGYECLLQPGEALLIPACWWHYLEYQTLSLSLSLRFGRNSYTQFLGDRLHTNVVMQNLAALMINSQAIAPKELEAFHQLETVHRQPCSNSLLRAKQIQQVAEACLDCPQAMYSYDHFQELIEQVLNQEATQRYPIDVDLRLLTTGWAQFHSHITKS